MGRKKEITIDEIFCGMPYLKKYFRNQERMIEKFGEGNEDNPAVRDMKKERKELLDAAKRMTAIDLKVIYYINSLPAVSVNDVLTPLKKMYVAQCELRNAVNGTKKYKDVIGDEQNE